LPGSVTGGSQTNPLIVVLAAAAEHFRFGTQGKFRVAIRPYRRFDPILCEPIHDGLVSLELCLGRRDLLSFTSSSVISQNPLFKNLPFFRRALNLL
jgi:hypothetical protein